MESKTILFIMPRLPFPPSSGRKTSLYHYCKIISEKMHYRLVVAAFLEPGDIAEDIPNFIDRLEILPTPSMKEKLINITLNSIIRKKYPFQVALFLSRAAMKIVDAIISEEKPEIIIGDMIRSVEYIRGRKAFTIADLDDRISLRYKRQIATDIDNINPYGAFISTVPNIFKRILLLYPIKIAVMTNEIRLLHKYELFAGEECSATIFVAEKETKKFNYELGIEKAISVPIGVDTGFFSYRKCGGERKIIGFLGAMNVAHNENAVKYFIKNVFPNILEKLPDTKFVVIGGGVSEELKALSSENIFFTGRVDDVREPLQLCNVFVCPMLFGSGIKTKNLEAMSLGLPVVTTKIGAENINAVSGRDWIVTDNELSEHICSLLINRERQINMGIHASKFVMEHFTWEVAERQFESLFEKACMQGKDKAHGDSQFKGND